MSHTKEQRGGRAFHPIVAFRMASKGLLRSAPTSLLAVGILALGLAAPATFFSLLVGSIRPLPVPEGNRIVRVDIVQPEQDGRVLSVLAEDVLALNTPAGLEALGAFRTFSGTLIDPGVAATLVSAAALTPDVLPTLRVQPEIGRFPSVDDADRTLLIGHDVWEDSYGSDPGVLGRSVDFEGQGRTIVGVMPSGFGFPFKENSWVVFDPATGGEESLEFVGRLADGASTEEVEAELAARWSQLDAVRPAERQGGVLSVQAFTGGRGEGDEAVAFIGLVLVALCLLLIACANVANLLLVRATERVRALGIQAALGASRIQIGMQLLLEALLIAAVGGGIGLLLAWSAVDAIQGALAAEHWGYHWMRMAVDVRVLGFTSILVIGTALAAGMLPVIRVLRVDVQRVLKEEASGSAMGRGGLWGRIFVTTQLALSCGALVAAGLTGRAMNGSNGFGEELKSEGVLLSSVILGVEDPAGRELLVGRLRDGLAAIPRATSAAVAIGAPAFLEPWGTFEFDGEPVERASDRARGNWNGVTPQYFDVLGVRLLTGRMFSGADVVGAAPVAVVNESWVRRFSADVEVLGRTVRIAGQGDSDSWHTIVGVVSDARVVEAERIRHDRVYLPLGQTDVRSVLLLVRAEGDASGLAPDLRRTVTAIDPSLALSSVRTLADGHAFMIRIPRAMGALSLAGGLAGLLVAAVGLYGLLAFRVRQRRRELGVRLALGADGAQLARDTVRFALSQLIPAIVIGLTLAWLAAPILSVMLLGLDPRSPSTFAGVAVAFLAVGLVAAGIPAWRASRTEPARVLRGS